MQTADEFAQQWQPDPHGRRQFAAAAAARDVEVRRAAFQEAKNITATVLEGWDDEDGRMAHTAGLIADAIEIKIRQQP